MAKIGKLKTRQTDGSLLHSQKTTPVPLHRAATPALRRMTHRVIGLSYPFSSFSRA